MTLESTSALTVAALTEALPESIRPLLLIDSVPLPPEMLEIVAASLGEASRLLVSVVTPDRVCNVVVGKRPFGLELPVGVLTFTPFGHVVHATVNNLIFLDAEWLVRVPPAMRVATVLEELVHAFMRVTDELFVMKVVADLYLQVAVVNGQYVEVRA